VLDCYVVRAILTLSLRDKNFGKIKRQKLVRETKTL